MTSDPVIATTLLALAKLVPPPSSVNPVKRTWLAVMLRSSGLDAFPVSASIVTELGLAQIFVALVEMETLEASIHALAAGGM